MRLSTFCGLHRDTEHFYHWQEACGWKAYFSQTLPGGEYTGKSLSKTNNSTSILKTSKNRFDEKNRPKMSWYDSSSERRKTERQMTEHRMTERRKTQHRMT